MTVITFTLQQMESQYVTYALKLTELKQEALVLSEQEADWDTCEAYRELGYEIQVLENKMNDLLIDIKNDRACLSKV